MKFMSVQLLRWRPGFLSLLLTVAGLLVAGLAFGQEVRVHYKIRGFSPDQKQMLVQIDDINSSDPFLQVWDVDPPAPAKKAQKTAFVKSEGPKFIRETRKKLKMADAGVEDWLYPLDPKDDTKALSFFGLMASKDRFVLACTDKQKLGKVKDIPIKIDEETKTQAKAKLEGIFWTTDRKLLIAVVSQKIDTGTFLSERDEFHVVRFNPSDIQWVDNSPEPPAK